MVMIIGGAYQGKRVYAEEQFPGIKLLDGETMELSELFTCQGVDGFHHIIRRVLQKESMELSELVKQLCEKNPDLVLISEEVGYGVVPIDAFDRKYREAVGRTCTQLAAFSETVIRVICGNGMVIKHA